MKLNIKKINTILKSMDRKPIWLEKKSGVSRQRIYYYLKTASVKGAEPIGKALGVDPKDLLI